MQKGIALALVIGAFILGAALAYHARQLGQLSAQLQATQQQMATLDTNLQSLARELPLLIEQAGKNAGRQAVHGMAEEAIQMPLNWLKSAPLKSAGDGLRHILSPANTGAGTTNKDVPLIQFDIPQPTVINIGILSDFEELSAWLRLPRGSQDNPAGPTNQAGGQMEKSTRSASPQ